MFGLGKSKAQDDRPEIRDVLFGDVPISRWLGSSDSNEEPWPSFRAVKRSLDEDETSSAKQNLQKIIEMPDLESRHYLQSWHFLRSLGINPGSEKEKELLGVVVEVGMPKGVDLVAAYADRHARYFNFSGAAVIWERPDHHLDAAIANVLAAGSTILGVIGPWDKARPAAPPNGQARINLLTPSGLHFGQGPLDTLMKDARGGPVMGAALRLMQELIRLTKK